MRNPSKRYFEIHGAALLLAAIIVGAVYGAAQYRVVNLGGGVSILLLIGFLLTAGGLVLLLKRLIDRVSRDMDEVIETVERIGRGELSCSLPPRGKGGMHRLCTAINQMAVDLQTATAPRERLRQEIDDRRAVESALADSRRLWKKTFNAVPDLIAILDDQHRILKMNAAMADTLGVTAKTWEGKACFTCMHHGEAPREVCPHSRMLSSGEVHTNEYFEPNLGRWLQVRVSPLRDAAGVIMGGVHVARDIHTHKELEAELAQRNAELERSVNALEAANQRIVEQQKQLIKEERLNALLQMAGATAHEMNQPLMALLGNIELLQHASSPPERKATHIRRISEAGSRLAEIVRKIQTLRHDEVRPYPGGLMIVDLHQTDTDNEDRRTG
ncbi:MAG: PAS domain-containing protein [Desulfosarcinaceae bacterium]|nr:PAS domain-containing protein [Desulfosarcinaceae bacterium]